jgi:glycosyltransferase involved in cell wall biosynthesis
MRVVIEATELGLSFGSMNGVSRCIFHLIDALARIDTSNEYVVFFNSFRRRRLRRQMEEHLRLPSNWAVAQASIPLRLCETARLEVELQLGRFDVFHGTFDYLPPIRCGKRVVTIHDVRYLEEDLDRLIRDDEMTLADAPRRVIKGLAARRNMMRWQRRTVARTVDAADVIITHSLFSARRIAQTLEVEPAKIHALYPGVERRFSLREDQGIAATLRRYRLPSRYILYVNRFDTLKNPTPAIRAFAQIAHEYPDLYFVLCGPEDYCLSHLKDTIRHEGHDERVLFPGFVDESDLPGLYAGAELFVLPSLYEGFGLPLIEGLASGTPVVASATSSLPEIAGEAALLVDPRSVDSLRETFRAILGNRELQETLRAKGRDRAAEFSWDTYARKTLEIYESVATAP